MESGFCRTAALILLAMVAPSGCSPARPATRAASSAPSKEVEAIEQFIQHAHWDGITGLAFSTSGRYLASSARDRTLRIWEPDSRRAVRIFRSDYPTRKLAWNGDDLLLVGRGEAQPLALSVQHAKPLGVVSTPEFPWPITRDGAPAATPWAVVLDPEDFEPWCSDPKDPQLVLFDRYGTQQHHANPRCRVTPPAIQAMAVAPGGSAAVLICKDSYDDNPATVLYYDTLTSTALDGKGDSPPQKLSVPLEHIDRLKLDAAAHWAVTERSVERQPVLELWSLPEAQKPKLTIQPGRRLVDWSLSADGKSLAALSLMERGALLVKLYDLEGDGAPAWQTTLRPEEDGATSEETRLAEWQACTEELANRRSLQSVECAEQVKAARGTPNDYHRCRGDRASQNQPLEDRCEAARAAYLREERQSLEAVAGAVAISPDGRTVAVGHSDGTIRLHDAASGRPLGELGSRLLEPLGVVFEGDELTIETQSQTLHFSLKTGELLGRSITDQRRAAAPSRRAPEEATDEAPYPVKDGPVTAKTCKGSVCYVGTQNGSLLRFDHGRLVARGTSDGLDIRSIHLGSGQVVTRSRDRIVRSWEPSQLFVEALFVAFADGEWMTATPKGAYIGTSEVGERIGWIFEHPLEFFSFEQFVSRFENPALLRRRLGGEPVEARLVVHRPPVVQLLEPQSPYFEADGEMALRLKILSQNPVQSLRVYVEGRLARVKQAPGRDEELTVNVPLAAGINVVSVVAFDERGAASNVRQLHVVNRGLETRVGRLWIVAIGVGSYPHLLDDLPLSPAVRAQQLSQLQLPAAPHDAEALAQAFGALAPSPVVTTLIDDAATPGAIRAAMERLADMAPEDTAVISFAGHGVKVGEHGEMVFVTSNARLTAKQELSPESLKSASLGWQAISEALGKARGRVLVLLDACHAGHITQDLLVPNAALAERLVRNERAGAIVFAAAKGRQLSYEGAAARALVLKSGRSAPAVVEHGFFSGALIASLSDPATDRNDDGQVQVSELIAAVEQRVVDLSRGLQTPWVARRELFGDFTLGRLSR